MFRVRSIRDGNDICDRMNGSLRSVGDASIFFLGFSAKFVHQATNQHFCFVVQYIGKVSTTFSSVNIFIYTRKQFLYLVI